MPSFKKKKNPVAIVLPMLAPVMLSQATCLWEAITGIFLESFY